MTVHCKWQDAHRGCEPQREGLMPDLINLLHPPLSSQLMYLVIERTNDQDTILSHRRETSCLMFNLLHLVLFMFSWFACSAYPERVIESSAAEESKFGFHRPSRQPKGKSGRMQTMWQQTIIIIIPYNKAHMNFSCVTQFPYYVINSHNKGTCDMIFHKTSYVNI